MNTDRIKEIQQETAYPESVSVQQALLKVWNETEQEQLRIGAVMRRLPTCEDVKRWHALLVGQGEEAMQKDIEATFA